MERQFELAKGFASDYPDVYAKEKRNLTASFSTCAPDLAAQLPAAK